MAEPQKKKTLSPKEQTFIIITLLLALLLTATSTILTITALNDTKNNNHALNKNLLAHYTCNELQAFISDAKTNTVDNNQHGYNYTELAKTLFDQNKCST